MDSYCCYTLPHAEYQSWAQQATLTAGTLTPSQQATVMSYPSKVVVRFIVASYPIVHYL